MQNLDKNTKKAKTPAWKRALTAYASFCDLQARVRDQY